MYTATAIRYHPGMPRLFLLAAAAASLCVSCPTRARSAGDDPLATRAERFTRAVAASDRVLHAWLKQADPRTLLLPDRLVGPGDGRAPGNRAREYTPHNSGADLYPYLILTADLTAPDLLNGRLLQMLRSDVRYTTSTRKSVPGPLNLDTGVVGAPSLFGAGEYA